MVIGKISIFFWRSQTEALPSPDMENVSPHSLRAWWLATRPKTLSGALIPVITAIGLAVWTAHSDSTTPVALLPHAAISALLCAFFAALMQVASNLINDLFDFRKGRDGEDRLGPERACAQGWISPRAMQRAIICVIALACIVGCCLTGLLLQEVHLPKQILLSGLVGTGAFCLLGAFLYTTHLSRFAMGDLMVLVFFGWVPVSGTYFSMTGQLSLKSLILGTAIGLTVDTLLVVNNYRDHENDRKADKHTLIVLIGARAGEWFDLRLGCAAWGCLCVLDLQLHGGFHPRSGAGHIALCTLPYVTLHINTWQQLRRIRKGRALNVLLGKTSRNMLVLSLLFLAGLWWG